MSERKREERRGERREERREEEADGLRVELEGGCAPVGERISKFDGPIEDIRQTHSLIHSN